MYFWIKLRTFILEKCACGGCDSEGEIHTFNLCNSRVKYPIYVIQSSDELSHRVGLRTTDGVLNKVTGLRSGEMCFGGEDSEGERFCF